jgi:phage shock protein A
MTQETPFGEGLASFFRGIGSFFRTGAWHVEAAAEEAETVDLLLDHAPEAIEQDAAAALEVIDDGLTGFKSLENRLARAKRNVEEWQSKQATAVELYNGCAADDPKKADYERLAKAAITQRQKAEAVVATLSQVIEESRPVAEAALQSAEEAGLSREDALSQVDMMRIQNASAEVKRRLAMAHRNGGTSKAQAMLHNAQAKIDQKVAAAQAGEMVNAVLPQSPEQIGRQLDHLSREGRVDAEFAALTGGSATTK